MKRKLQMIGGIPSEKNVADKKRRIKLRDRQPHYGPVIVLRTLCHGTHGRERDGRQYHKAPNIAAPGINPLLLMGKRMSMAMMAAIAFGHAFVSSRKKTPRGR